MEKKDFEGKVGSVFKAKTHSNETVELRLKSIDPLKRVEGVPNARKEPFSLVFVGPKDQHLQDNSYQFTVEGWEDKTIFISAFKEDIEGIHYDAVFN